MDGAKVKSEKKGLTRPSIFLPNTTPNHTANRKHNKVPFTPL